MFWITLPRSTAATAGEDSPHERIVVQVTSSSPAGQSGLALLMPVSPGGDTGAGGTASERSQDAFDKWVAKWLVDRAWEGSTKVWVTPVCDAVESLAEGLSGFQHEWHYLVLGNQGESVDQQMSLELASNDVLAGIATELPLPGVASINAIKRIVQFTGIIIGVVAGEPLLAKACLKWLAHDCLAEVVSKEIENFLRSTLELAGTRERDLKDLEVEREISRQIEELKKLLENERRHRQEMKTPRRVEASQLADVEVPGELPSFTDGKVPLADRQPIDPNGGQPPGPMRGPTT